MKITVLTSDAAHPVFVALQAWAACMTAGGHAVDLQTERSRLGGGDYLFLVSCGEIVTAGDRARYRHTLVLHASDLPKGRGWSPHIWSIVRGERRVIVSLIEATEKVDRGDIWAQRTIEFEGNELLPEINARLFAVEMELMTEAVERGSSLVPRPQPSEGATYERKRTPEDSRLDPEKTIAEQFDLLRVVDNERYPAFFEYRGQRYELKITKRGKG